MRIRCLILMVASLFMAHVACSTAAPILFFVDIDSGPNSGGENTDSGAHTGSYVTLYGNFFGTSPTVTLNGSSCLRLVGAPTTHLWYQQQVVQLNSSCSTGNFILSTAQGASNGIAFTVRSGNIRCVATSGSNANSGSFPSSCWATPAFAKNTMAPGDITYVHTGTYTGLDGDAAFLDLHVVGGTAGNPLTMTGYPGELPVFDTACCTYGLLAWGSAGPSPYWTISNIEWKNATYREIYWEMGGSPAPQIGTVRIIGNVIHDAAAELITYEGSGTNIVTDGNNLYNMANTGGQKGYAVYWGAYGTQAGVDFGWNQIHNELSGNRDAKGLQFYGHVAGDMITGVTVRNNKIFGACMEGAVMGGSDGGNSIWSNSDTELIYNNVFVHDGPCSPNFGYSSIKFVGGTGNFKVYNNTFYYNGASPLTSPSGDVDDQGVNTAGLDWRNNIHFAPTPNGTYCGYICFEGGSSSDFNSSSDYNDCINYGSNSCPATIIGTHSLHINPSFTSPTLSVATADFTPQSGSPVLGVGSTATLATVATDITGLPRPSPPSMGAFELTSGGSNPPPAPCGACFAGLIKQSSGSVAVK